MSKDAMREKGLATRADPVAGDVASHRGVLSVRDIPSFPDHAYAHAMLRRRIVSLEMPPGSEVQEAALLQELEVGRVALQTALLRLAREGLVTIAPRKRTLVTEVRMGDLLEVSEVRIELEGLGARRAAEHRTAEDVAHIDSLLLELRQIPRMDSWDAFIDLDIRIHNLLYAMSRNSFLTEDLCRYYYLALRLWFVVVEELPALPDVVVEHEKLLETVRSGNGREAEQLARHHVVAFDGMIRETI